MPKQQFSKAAYLIIILMLASLSMNAQVRSSFSLEGLILDDLSMEAIPNVTIECIRTKEKVVSDNQGRFFIEVKRTDVLYLSRLGYTPMEVQASSTVLEEALVFIIKMKSERVNLEEVEVEADKSIPLELRSEVFQEKPKTGQAIQHPLSALFYHSNREEKQKRQIINSLEQEELRAKYAHIYNKETIAKHSSLSGTDLDWCIIYCNTHMEITSSDTNDMVERKLLQTISAYLEREKAKQNNTAQNEKNRRIGINFK